MAISIAKDTFGQRVAPCKPAMRPRPLRIGMVFGGLCWAALLVLPWWLTLAWYATALLALFKTDVD